MGIEIDVAELAGVIAEAILYGVFLTLTFGGGYFFVRRKLRQASTVNLPMAITCLILLCLTTAQLSVDTANIFTAFLDYETRSARLAYFSDVKTRLFQTKHSIWVCTLFVSDSFMNYRCWVVWSRNIKIIALPLALSIASIACGFHLMWVLAHIPSWSVVDRINWMTTTMVLSLTSNAISTGLISYRIWSHDKQLSDVETTTRLKRPTKLRRIVKILVESGAVNAAHLLSYTIVASSRSEGLELIAETATPTVGIIFAIVIIRLGLNSEVDEDWSIPRRSSKIIFAGVENIAVERRSRCQCVDEAQTQEFARAQNSSTSGV